jgi:hypothetical protein
LFIFQIGSCELLAQGWLQIAIFLISGSGVARITGDYRQWPSVPSCALLLYFLKKFHPQHCKKRNKKGVGGEKHLKFYGKPVEHAHYPSAQEAEARGLRVGRKPGLQ